MYALLSFCSNDGQSGKIYRELFEQDIINVFLYAYNACHSDPEAKLTLSKMREQFSNCVGTKIVSKSSLMARSTFGKRIFSKLALHIIDKVIQRKYDRTWQRAATEEFESNEEHGDILKHMEGIVEKELRIFEDMLLIGNIEFCNHSPVQGG